MLAGALWRAGWAVSTIPIMLAVARAESGCHLGAAHIGREERSLGPLQINVAAHRWCTEACALSWECSARAALRIYSDFGLRAWTAYRTGAYLRFYRRR